MDINILEQFIVALSQPLYFSSVWHAACASLAGRYSPFPLQAAFHTEEIHSSWLRATEDCVRKSLCKKSSVGGLEKSLQSNIAGHRRSRLKSARSRSLKYASGASILKFRGCTPKRGSSPALQGLLWGLVPPSHRLNYTQISIGFVAAPGSGPVTLTYLLVQLLNQGQAQLKMQFFWVYSIQNQGQAQLHSQSYLFYSTTRVRPSYTHNSSGFILEPGSGSITLTLLSVLFHNQGQAQLHTQFFRVYSRTRVRLNYTHNSISFISQPGSGPVTHTILLVLFQNQGQAQLHSQSYWVFPTTRVRPNYTQNSTGFVAKPRSGPVALTTLLVLLQN
jgi:hypothetical protein